MKKIFVRITLIAFVAIFVSKSINGMPVASSDDDDTVEVISNEISDPLQPENAIDLGRFGSALFGTPDTNKTAEAVANYKEESGVNPEELGSYLEGDILIPKHLTRNGMLSKSLRWPNGVVPFEIRGSFNAWQMATIENAINDYHANTCIRFVPRTNEPDYISIVNGNSGCWSSVGKIGGKQEVNLQTPGCMTKKGTVIHELLHALGFLHEQNRWERDEFVEINFDNIQKYALTNFAKSSPSITSGFGVPYDYGSVLHYSANAFSKNGNPTIVAKQRGPRMGQREGFSHFDIEKVNAMYKCRNNGGSSGVRPHRPGSGSNTSGLGSSFIEGFINGIGLSDKGSRNKV